MACTTIAFGHPSEPPRFGLHNDDNCTKPPSVEVINFTTSEVVIIMRNESRIIKILMEQKLTIPQFLTFYGLFIVFNRVIDPDTTLK